MGLNVATEPFRRVVRRAQAHRRQPARQHYPSGDRLSLSRRQRGEIQEAPQERRCVRAPLTSRRVIGWSVKSPARPASFGVKYDAVSAENIFAPLSFNPPRGEFIVPSEVRPLGTTARFDEHGAPIPALQRFDSRSRKAWPRFADSSGEETPGWTAQAWKTAPIDRWSRTLFSQSLAPLLGDPGRSPEVSSPAEPKRAQSISLQPF